MPFVRCKCGKLLSLPAELVGRRVRCSACAQAITVARARTASLRAGPVEPPAAKFRRADLTTRLAFASLIPVVLASLCVGLTFSRRSDPASPAEATFARPGDTAACEPRYAGDTIEPLPKLPGAADTGVMRAAVLHYLEKKSGRKVTATVFSPGTYAAGACVEEYDAAGRNKSSAERNRHCYRALHGHLLGAEELFQETDPERRLDGLDVVREAALCSVERLGDKWLAPRICHGFLIPRLHHASTESYDKLSTANLLATSIYVFGQAGSKADLITAYRLLLHFSDDANTREATRLRLANELAGQGDVPQAIRYLKGIQPDGHIGGARALIQELENKLQAKQRKELTDAK